MSYTSAGSIVTQTKDWITNVVVGCHFCPFAAKEVMRNSIYYEVLDKSTTETVLKGVIKMLYRLDDTAAFETSFLIIPEGFGSFNQFLRVLELAETLLAKEKYEGIYQLAGFHPKYLFAGSTDEDPSNFTNRSPYPMIHFLREASVSKAVDNYPGIDEIPDRNIAFAKEKGLIFMQKLMGG